MSAATRRAYKKALEDGNFAPAYYVHGEDEYLKEEAVRRLVDRAVEPATRDFNLDMRRGSELDAEAVERLLDTPPMMATRRVVVIRDVGSLKKGPRSALDRALTRRAPDTIVVLVTSGAGKPDKALAEACVDLDYANLKEDQVVQWVAHQVAAGGGSITTGAAELLQQAIGSDLGELCAEVDKLLSYAGGAEIDEAAVAAIVGIHRGGTLADLLDRVGERNAGAALAVVPAVVQQPKTTAVSIVMSLTVQMLALAWGRALLDRGMPAGRINFFDFLGENRSSLVGRPWGEATKAWGAAIRHWPAGDIERALSALLTADVALKGTRISSDEEVLASLVLTLCGAPTRQAA
ncbi:MAG: DNA polymerase III subunit delta [Gemmatimonadaceae bacterium]